ncbi:MRN complex-interacting protein [Otolemur garnettii]|uniref:MRN complex-interacting protein n=1 Tax=Otolemur garnettii TaxID=30611 RepID=UPI000643F002|nr:MRN complex-interacting protein [Otolemur garnettii]
MATPQRARVLRCCSCCLFQAHQVKKSVKWTCKACGEKQSFVRAYGEGSGADCRRHVQKLNLLQGQISELRSLEGHVGASEEECTGHQQAENVSLQEKAQPSQSRWVKYLEKDSQEPELGGVYFDKQLSSRIGGPARPFSQDLPRKRKWSQSTVQLPGSFDAQDSEDSEVTLEPQKGSSSLIGDVRQDNHCLQNSADYSSRELGGPLQELQSPTQQLKSTPSKWAQFLLSTGDSSHVDIEPHRPLQRGTRSAGSVQADQGTCRAQIPREGHLSRPTTPVQLPESTHTTSGSKRPCWKASEQLWDMGTPWAESRSLAKGVQKPPPMRLCDLFTTGEDFDL